MNKETALKIPEISSNNNLSSEEKFEQPKNLSVTDIEICPDTSTENKINSYIFKIAVRK